MLFNDDLEQFKSRYNAIAEAITDDMLKTEIARRQYTKESLKKEFDEDSSAFHQFVYAYASQAIPGRVSSVTYGAIVARLAQYFGVPYKVFAGYCLWKGSSSYEDNKKKFEEDENTAMVTCLIVKTKTHNYQMLSEHFDNIDYLKVVKL